ncbi:hypothetical protein LTR95_013595, partial [Oleoguttula sp. CCFEE 5521]
MGLWIESLGLDRDRKGTNRAVPSTYPPPPITPGLRQPQLPPRIPPRPSQVGLADTYYRSFGQTPPALPNRWVPPAPSSGQSLPVTASRSAPISPPLATSRSPTISPPILTTSPAPLTSPASTSGTPPVAPSASKANSPPTAPPPSRSSSLTTAAPFKSYSPPPALPPSPSGLRPTVDRAAPSQAKVNPRNFRDQHEPRESDVFIAVMGVTGAGKSIDQQGDQDRARYASLSVPFGVHKDGQEANLGSTGTRDVAVFLCKYSEAINVYLVDTPGFDDTDRSDADILREIASWLTTSYANSIKLHGIIYLHRITDIRMQGSAKNNLIMFRKLCGHNALKNVILATTMWERVHEPDGVERERQLKAKQEFWGYMIDNGSQLHRHQNTQDSALQLIGSLVSRQAHKAKVVLDIQAEIVDHGKSLSDTAAGQAVDNAVAQERNKIAKELAYAQADMKQALAEKDRGTAEVLRQHSEEMNAKMRKLDREHSALKVTMERMQDER